MLVFKCFIFYILVVLLFDNYDVFLILVEKFFHVSFSYRSIFLFYSLNLFFLIVILSYPLRLSSYLWSFRYYFVFLLVQLWILSGFVNSIDIFLSSLWDVFNNNKFNVLYGPTFYLKFIHKTNYELVWSNRMKTNKFFDSWFHFNIHKPFYYRFYYLKYLHTFEYIFYKYYYSVFLFFKNFFYNHFFTYINISMSKIFVYSYNLNIFNYNFGNKKEFLSSNEIFNQFFFIFFNKKKLYNFHRGTSWYSHFVFNFFFLISYKFKFYQKIVDKPIFGSYFKYLLSDLVDKQGKQKHIKTKRFKKNGYSIKNRLRKIMLLCRLSYYHHMFDNLRFTLWGQYKASSQHFFMFYRKKWFMSEKHFFYLHMTNLTEALKRKKNYSWDFEVNKKLVLVKDLKIDSTPTGRVNRPLDYINFKRPDIQVYNRPIKGDNYLVANRSDIQYKRYLNSSLFYTKYLLPDMGFIGSSMWGTNFKFLSIDKNLRTDTLFLKNGRRPFRRHW